MEGRAVVGVCSRPFARTSRATLLVEALQGTGTAPSSSSSSTTPKATFESGNHEVEVATGTPAVPAVTSIPSEEETCSKEPVQEYAIRVPKTFNPASIMRFNEALGVNPEKWRGLKMTREGSSKIRASKFFGGVTEGENMPKFGAGSEYGREAREEAKRLKYGGRNKKKYNADDQPWIMKVSGKGSRKYRGVKAGVSENASYYIFARAEDGILDMVPVNNWYNFTPIQSYKNLTAEQAEEEFERRNKIHNYFSVMVRNRLKDDVDNEEDDEKVPTGKTLKKSSSELKVTEMEDWEDSDTNESEEDNEKEEADKKPRKKKCVKAHKKRTGSNEDAGKEDSDDGDEEGRELDYISDTTDTESEDEKEKEIAEAGVDQETTTKTLSDSDDEEKDEEVGKDLDDEMEKQRPAEKSERNGDTEKFKETSNSTKKFKLNTEYSNKTVERLSDDCDEAKTDELQNPTETKCESSFSSNISGGSPCRTMDLDSTNGSKRKASSDLIGGIINPQKKSKIELSPSLVQSAISEGITENAIRRYLLRRPMTVAELLRKFKTKKATIPSHDMVRVIAHILDKINPEKRTQNQKLYLYLTDNSA